jgi:hypothetical protein
MGDAPGNRSRFRGVLAADGFENDEKEDCSAETASKKEIKE